MAAEDGLARLPWRDIGTQGEDRLLRSRISFACLLCEDGSPVDAPNHDGVSAEHQSLVRNWESLRARFEDSLIRRRAFAALVTHRYQSARRSTRAPHGRSPNMGRPYFTASRNRAICGGDQGRRVGASPQRVVEEPRSWGSLSRHRQHRAPRSTDTEREQRSVRYYRGLRAEPRHSIRRLDVEGGDVIVTTDLYPKATNRPPDGVRGLCVGPAGSVSAATRTSL
jgi:hypothetical protein